MTSSEQWTACRGLHEMRGEMDTMESWQERQNGDLHRIAERIDKVYLLLLASFGTAILTLLAIVIDIARKGF